MVYPTQLRIMMAFLDMAVRFHKPFHPLGLSKFWKEVEQAMNKEKCSEEVEAFLKTVELDSDLQH